MKGKVIEENVRKALEMYQQLNAVITSRRFLERVAIAYIDFDNGPHSDLV